MDRVIALFSVLWIAASCAPSEQSIQTAIAETRAAEPTATAWPSPTARAAATAIDIPTPTTPKGFTIGNIRYQIPTTGPGWCVVTTETESDREIHRLFSGCRFTRDPSTSISVYHFYPKFPSVAEVLKFFVQDHVDYGFELVKFTVMSEDQYSSVGPVTLATLHMTYQGKPFDVDLQAFRINGESYIVEGQSPSTLQAVRYELESMKSLIDSIVPVD